MTHKKLLIIDDDNELVDLMSEYLGKDNYVIDSAGNGRAGQQKAEQDKPDLIVLDVMMPVQDGIETLKKLRESASAAKSIPVIMLTARGDDVDRIIGLEMGADDYLPKPFNPRELKARIQAVLRRMDVRSETEGQKIIEVDELKIDLSAYTVTQGGVELDLTTTEFQILKQLLQHAGNVVSKQLLSEVVLDKKLSPYDRSLDMHISNLRKKINDNPDTPRIKTVRGIGYQYLMHQNIV